MTNMDKRENKEQVTKARWKSIGLFVVKTLFYFCVLLALVYLYEYSGVGSAHFIYNEF